MRTQTKKNLRNRESGTMQKEGKRVKERQEGRQTGRQREKRKENTKKKKKERRKEYVVAAEQQTRAA